ncbi:(deoxy)nucleoside triphosphate pyrophosphohydrolase [Rathayibacter iranicus]|uniref:8-oxo-dGTP diphosphatase n=2 Tax=Rathayibacter iranicus TaxID=59737 RepID=A0AAD1AHQ0_9MICO|nr:(deoxy)nucleoside triphosphate pyrophosphohydrolase [Rathayibacter iranicus]AZZ57520.1 (deoxy)nucleoside triphosphate pyrophosphohydrolase [Rathayibacter iranicus]MWV29614.1 NUDIX domain-containing protein [Rathayibacter iranicus NCPPB 2253 = VKM Ac-1602]PPI41966.1 DNA mismatch repair protein MutT [Rathayibacter iranicus]PPI57668.1 DNA mismatch repair protein MutT [Rathayibacter iranicus]PPI68686.1 DNA mismatch repair protein MutT [Rathayibacter iranicus]
MRILSVAAAIITDDGHILACRRRADKISGGLWEFPGGKIEAEETPQAAVSREIREELGIHIAVGKLLTVDDTATSALTIRLHCYHATLLYERPTASSDHDRLLWLTPDELAALNWAAPDRPAVRLLSPVGD